MSLPVQGDEVLVVGTVVRSHLVEHADGNVTGYAFVEIVNRHGQVGTITVPAGSIRPTD